MDKSSTGGKKPISTPDSLTKTSKKGNVELTQEEVLSDEELNKVAGGKGIPPVHHGCWIAEAIYGIDDSRTHLVRAWLNGPYQETLIGSFVMAMYLAIGQQVAAVARRSGLVRAALKPLFDRALRNALLRYPEGLNDPQYFRDRSALRMRFSLSHGERRAAFEL